MLTSLGIGRFVSKSVNTKDVALSKGNVPETKEADRMIVAAHVGVSAPSPPPTPAPRWCRRASPPQLR